MIFSNRPATYERAGDVSDDTLWRDCKALAFWDHDVWLFPIHNPGTLHWTLAAVYWSTFSIAYFDSFADRQVYEADVLVSFE